MPLTRRDFLAAGSGLMAAGRALAAAPASLAIAHYKAPSTAPEGIAEEARRLTRAAIDSLGGMGRFVSKGQVVWVKPNIGWDRRPEQAACTNPDVVATLVEMCYQAGAKKVVVSDNPCNSAQRTFPRSGIQEAADQGRRAVLLHGRAQVPHHVHQRRPGAQGVGDLSGRGGGRPPHQRGHRQAPRALLRHPGHEEPHGGHGRLAEPLPPGYGQGAGGYRRVPQAATGGAGRGAHPHGERSHGRQPGGREAQGHRRRGRRPGGGRCLRRHDPGAQAGRPSASSWKARLADSAP